MGARGRSWELVGGRGSSRDLDWEGRWHEGNQRPPEGIASHQKESQAIRRNRKPSEGIKSHQKVSAAIRRHRKPSEGIGSHQMASSHVGGGSARSFIAT